MPMEAIKISTNDHTRYNLNFTEILSK